MPRRLLLWTESVVAVALAAYGTYVLGLGIVYGHRDPHHGGAYPIIFGILLVIGASAFAFGAWALRRGNAWGWLGQLFPTVVAGWVLWDVLSHSR